MLNVIRLVAIGLVMLGALPAAAQQTLEAVSKRAVDSKQPMPHVTDKDLAKLEETE